jgi:hypothetical protein
MEALSPIWLRRKVFQVWDDRSTVDGKLLPECQVLQGQSSFGFQC